MFDFPASPSVGTIYAPGGGPTYMWDGTTWNIVESSAFQSGCIKISESTLAVAGPSLDVDLPTSGYHTLELLLSEVNVPGSAVSISFDFSWDGGATFPNAANQYAYSQSSTNNAANGGSSMSGGGTTNAWVWWAIGNHANFKGFGNIRMPVIPAGVAVQQSRVSGYSGSVYVLQNTLMVSNILAGIPNKGRLRVSSGNMSAGLKLMLLGYR